MRIIKAGLMQTKSQWANCVDGVSLSHEERDSAFGALPLELSAADGQGQSTLQASELGLTTPFEQGGVYYLQVSALAPWPLPLAFSPLAP